MSEVILKLKLYTDKPLDREVLRLLENYRTPKDRKDFLLSSLLYYSRAPQFLAQESFRLLFEEYLGKLDKKLNTCSTLPVSSLFTSPTVETPSAPVPPAVEASSPSSTSCSLKEQLKKLASDFEC